MKFAEFKLVHSGSGQGIALGDEAINVRKHPLDDSKRCYDAILGGDTVRASQMEVEIDDAAIEVAALGLGMAWPDVADAGSRAGSG